MGGGCVALRVDAFIVEPCGMASIVHRKDRFYVVAYDGIDPLTGRERRRWHPGGDNRRAGEELASRLEGDRRHDSRTRATSTQLGAFLTDTWLPRKRAHVRATTACRYGWMIDRYVVPRLGSVELGRCELSTSTRSTRTFSPQEATTGRGCRPRRCTRRTSSCVTPSTWPCSAGSYRNVALAVHSPRPRRGGTIVARVWSAQNSDHFLAFARPQRLHPALHLVAHTGMRRDELVGLKWRDLDP